MTFAFGGSDRYERSHGTALPPVKPLTAIIWKRPKAGPSCWIDLARDEMRRRARVDPRLKPIWKALPG
jgi:hypothetical protein